MSLSPDGHLRTYTIYARPADYPWAAYVVRGSTITPGAIVNDQAPLGFAETIEVARDMVPREADTRFPRADGDPPQIVETWL